MPTLRELALKISYGPSDERLREFFIPAMAASVRYDRAAGYFSSTTLAVAATGVTKRILNDGKRRILYGADLSEDDMQAIDQGHSTLAQQVEKPHRFDRLWETKERDWVAMPRSDAIKQKLLKLRPSMPPTKEFGVDEPVPGDGLVDVKVDADQRERAFFNSCLMFRTC